MPRFHSSIAQFNSFYRRFYSWLTRSSLHVVCCCTVSSRNFNSQRLKSRVSNPRTIGSIKHALWEFKSPRVWAHFPRLSFWKVQRMHASMRTNSQGCHHYHAWTYAWTNWDLNPGPSACEAYVIPLAVEIAVPDRGIRKGGLYATLDCSASKRVTELW